MRRSMLSIPPAFVALMLALPATASASIAEVDLRSERQTAVLQRAAGASSGGIVLVAHGTDEEELAAVREAATAALAEGHAVTTIMRANGDGGKGVSVFGVEGKQFGPRMFPSVTLRDDLRAMIAELSRFRDQRAKDPSAPLPTTKVLLTGAVDPMDVPKCRWERPTGSRARKIEMCSTPREDAARAAAAREQTRQIQDAGKSVTNEVRQGGG